METISMLSKIAIPVGGVLFTALIGGRLFWTLVKHFLVKYFENAEKKVDAAFKRIDEQRDALKEFKNIDFRDYKRDIALAIQGDKDNIKELFERTDNHKEVQDCIDFCNARNKRGA